MSQSQIGLLITPWPAVVVIVAPIAGRLSDRYPAGLLGGLGLAVMAAGLLLMLALPANTTAGLYAACVVFVGANGRAGRVADVSVAMLTSAGRCAAAVTSG